MTPRVLETNSFQHPSRNIGGFRAEVIEVSRNENAISLRVSLYIERIGRTIREAVVRIELSPCGFAGRSVIDVVANHHHSTPITNGAFISELAAGPIHVEGDGLRHFHRINASPCRMETTPAHTDHPIANASTFSDGGLAGRQSTYAVKRIGREAKVSVHHIHVDPGHQQTTFFPE